MYHMYPPVAAAQAGCDPFGRDSSEAAIVTLLPVSAKVTLLPAKNTGPPLCKATSLVPDTHAPPTAAQVASGIVPGGNCVTGDTIPQFAHVIAGEPDELSPATIFPFPST